MAEPRLTRRFRLLGGREFTEPVSGRRLSRAQARPSLHRASNFTTSSIANVNSPSPKGQSAESTTSTLLAPHATAPAPQHEHSTCTEHPD